jgi:plasmid stabilization system protein ParE
MLPSVLANSMCGITKILEWLHDWQELAGGLIGAAALTLTVLWTLTAERRRDAKRAESVRIALGSEVRAFAAQMLRGAQELVTILTPTASISIRTHMRLQQFEDATRTVEPVIYPQTASDLGLLGHRAYEIVEFYVKFQAARDGLRRVKALLAPTDTLISVRQSFEIAEAWVAALESAIAALAAFPATPRSEHDVKFAQAVHETRSALAALRAGRP